MPTSPPPVAHAIRATDVSKAFGAGLGVHELDLSVAPGTIFGLIGPSGSGKTTTVRLLTGLLAPDAGMLAVLGEEPRRFTAETRQRIGYLPQDCVLYPTLSIRENLSFAAAMHGLSGRMRRDRVDQMLEVVGLADAAERRIADASGGMKRRAGVAAAFVHRPDLVFLDEPTAGLDPILRHSLWEEFQRLRESGTTIVVTTQYVGEVETCDGLVLLADGSIVATGTPEGLRRDAYGGELLNVRFDRPIGRTEVETIAARIDAASFRGTGLGEVEFVVGDAGTATAELNRAVQHSGFELVEVERRVPPLDEAFVRIVGRHRERLKATA